MERHSHRMLQDQHGRRSIAAYDCAWNVHLHANPHARLHPVVKAAIEMWIRQRAGVERAVGRGSDRQRPGRERHVRWPDQPLNERNHQTAIPAGKQKPSRQAKHYGQHGDESRKLAAGMTGAKWRSSDRSGSRMWRRSARASCGQGPDRRPCARRSSRPTCPAASQYSAATPCPAR